MLVGKITRTQDDENGQHQHGDVGKHDWKSLLGEIIGTWFENEIDTKSDEERLEYIDELDEPDRHQGHDDGRMRKDGQPIAKLLTCPRRRCGLHKGPCIEEVFKTSPRS